MLKFYSLNYNRKVAIGLFKWSQNSTLNREQKDECKDAADNHSEEPSPPLLFCSKWYLSKSSIFLLNFITLF